MSEHARRNLVCSSWHKVPEGFQSWSGMMRGYTTRPFCWDAAGHVGDHWAQIETLERFPTKTEVHNAVVGHKDFGKVTTEMTLQPRSERMEWPNTLGIPAWLVTTTHHGVKMMLDHGWSVSDILGGRTE